MSGRIFITGCAGFIGFHCARRLLADGWTVAGIDDLNDGSDVRLKEARLAELAGAPGFEFARASIAEADALDARIAHANPDCVLHLAAQAGVRHSLERPRAFTEANLVGFFNVLESCRRHRPRHLVFASSSSVYGARSQVPFAVDSRTDEPVSYYAATKKANEVMAYSYSQLYALPVTGLRFFTVYGPWGRPDMAYFSFTRDILAGRPITLFNHGRMQRDFTYIDDIVEGVVRVIRKIPSGTIAPGAAGGAPYRLYNIGNRQSVGLLEFVETLEAVLGRTSEKRFVDMQPGDVPVTCADVSDLEADVGFVPSTPLRTGLEQFVEWYRCFYA